MPKAYQDSLNFIGKLTLAKISNILLITMSFYLSRLTRKVIVWGKPISLSIEPTTSCNLRCPECPSGLRSFTRPTGMLDLALYNKTIDEQSKSLSYLLLYFQGEPFLHQNFVKMIKYAADKGIYTATSTNAHYFTDDVARDTVQSGLDRLIISIDGTTQHVYEQYRVGGSLEKVIEGTKKLVHWKKKLNSGTPHLIFQFLVVKPNEHQIAEVHKIQSLNPELLISHLDLYSALMLGEAPLKRAQREMLGVVVSVSNECDYCQVHHAKALIHFWKDEGKINMLIRDYHLVDLNETDKLLCDYYI